MLSQLIADYLLNYMVLLPCLLLMEAGVATVFHWEKIRPPRGFWIGWQVLAFLLVVMLTVRWELALVVALTIPAAL